jgi:hypothetical protein
MLTMFVCVGEVQAAKVKLNKSKATIYVGKSVTLKVKGTKQKVTWKSSKRKVASVNAKGKVTAKKAGTTIISAKVQKKTYKCRITVKNPYLNKKNVTLQEGKNVTLKITGTKAKKWSSSNKAVAVVNSKGKVTAKAEGVSTISCKGQNGKTYKCKITVTAKTSEAEDGKQDETKSDDTGQEDGKQDETQHTHEFVCTKEQESTCLEAGLKEYTCKICGEKKTEYMDILEHQLESSVTKEATCVQLGEISYACKLCKSVVKVEYTGVTEHDYEEIERKEATCYEDGYVSYKCKCCNYVCSDTLSSLDVHEWIEEYIPPTCESVGGTYVECKKCQSNSWREIEGVLPHDYEITIQPSTCIEEGHTLYKCKNCTKQYKTDYQEMLEHEYELQVVKEPTCEYSGYQSLVCKHCKHMNRDVWEEIEPLGHTPRIELVEGEKQGSCGVCGEVLFTVYYDNSHLSNVNKQMLYAEEHTVHAVPGLKMHINLYSKSAAYSMENFTLRLEDGTYEKEIIKTTDAETGEEIEEVISYCYNDVVKVKDMYIEGLTMGETRVGIYFGNKKLDEIPVSIDAYSLPEAVRLKLAGSTEDVTKGYIDRYVTMVDNTVAIIQEVTTEDMTKFEKAKALFRWMEDNITYGTSGTIMYGQKAWETISEKMAVCGGYAETVSFFMDVLEIPSYYMVHIPPDNPGHAWNMIWVDTGNGKGENWYYVDTTWTDYDFNITVDEMNAENVQPGLWGLHRATDEYKLGAGYYLGNESHYEQIDGSYISPLYE